MNSGSTPSYKPQAYYWRQEIRRSKSVAELRTIALHLVEELEAHKAEFRRNGLIPPKSCVTSSELLAKPQLARLSLRVAVQPKA